MKTIFLNISIALFITFSQDLVAQCLYGDCINGHGKFQYTSGAIYEGDFVNGKCQGKGILTFPNQGGKYLGNWKNGYHEGKGKMIFRQGNVYQGDWFYSKMQGKGTMYFANGDTYEGDWGSNKPHGYGEFKFKNGHKYVGNFSNGNFEGEGTMYYHDGSQYVGRWTKSKKNGLGIYVNIDGMVTHGKWTMGECVEIINNLPSEQIALTDQNTKLIEIENKIDESYNRDCNNNLCVDGIGTYWYSDGSKYVGNFKNGNPEGHGTVYYNNGDRYTGQWRNHSPHGDGILYYNTGRVLGALFERGRVVHESTPNQTPIILPEVEVDFSPEVKIWTVIVGVGDYKHMPKLKYTDDDAAKLFSHFKSTKGGSLPNQRIQILLDQNATRQNIIKSLSRVFYKADDNDVVIFYFSGHGLEGSFLPVDYNGYHNRIFYNEVIDVISKSNARHKLVIADACYSGGLGVKSTIQIPNPQSKLQDAFQNTSGGIALLLSSRPDEVSFEDHMLESGVFTHYLMKGLNGDADYDKNSIVTLKELFSFVQLEVRNRTKNTQNPTISGEFDYNTPLSVISDSY